MEEVSEVVDSADDVGLALVMLLEVALNVSLEAELLVASAEEVLSAVVDEDSWLDVSELTDEVVG